MEELINELIDEIVDNKIRMSKLANFISSEKFKNINNEHKALIKDQCELTDTLNDVLKKRISNLILNKDEKGENEDGENFVQ